MLDRAARWSRSIARQEARRAARHCCARDDVKTAIIFCNRKTTVRELASSLKRGGFAAGQIHGDMEQSERIARARPVQERRDQHPGRLRRRRARARHQGRQPRLQLTTCPGIRTIMSTASAAPAAPARPASRSPSSTPRGCRSDRQHREADRHEDRRGGQQAAHRPKSHAQRTKPTAPARQAGAARSHESAREAAPAPRRSRADARPATAPPAARASPPATRREQAAAQPARPMSDDGWNGPVPDFLGAEISLAYQPGCLR